MSKASPQIACIYIDENHEKNLIGGLVLHHPASLQELILDIQQKENHFDEIKFSKISTTKLSLYQKVLQKISRYQYEKYYCKQYVSKLTYLSYIDFVQSIVKSYHNIDYFLVFVDYCCFPKWVLFEKLMIESSESIIFCLREDSKSSKLLQITDLLLGCIGSYFGENLIESPNKIKLLETFKKLKLRDKIMIL